LGAPRGGKSESDHERQSNDPLRESVFAPSLEHGYRSNDKQENRAHTEHFHPHVRVSNRMTVAKSCLVRVSRDMTDLTGNFLCFQ
jgi:hypothetical protein